MEQEAQGVTGRGVSTGVGHFLGFSDSSVVGRFFEDSLEMVTGRSPKQRATTWLCLAVAMLITLMPSAGVMVCLGHDGHLGIGTVAETGTCPCEHDSVGQDEPSAALVENEERHPPCRDVALDPPDVVKGTEFAPKLANSTDTPSDDHSPAIAAWLVDNGWAEIARAAAPPWATAEAARLSKQLEQRRTIVLLI